MDKWINVDLFIFIFIVVLIYLCLAFMDLPWVGMETEICKEKDKHFIKTRVADLVPFLPDPNSCKVRCTKTTRISLGNNFIFYYLLSSIFLVQEKSATVEWKPVLDSFVIVFSLQYVNNGESCPKTNKVSSKVSRVLNVFFISKEGGTSLDFANF